MFLGQWSSLGSMATNGSIQLGTPRYHDLNIMYKQEFYPGPIYDMSFLRSDSAIPALPSIFGMTILWSFSSTSKSSIPRAYLTSGVSTARYRVDGTGLAAGMYRVLQTVTRAGLYSISVFLCTQGGLPGQYYTDPDFSMKDLGFAGIDSTISFDWGGFGPPVDGIPTNGFSVRWTGFLKIPTTDVYTFMLNSNDEANLFIGENLVLTSGRAFPIRAATLSLNVYTMYPIHIDYRERLFDARIYLLYGSISIYLFCSSLMRFAIL